MVYNLLMLSKYFDYLKDNPNHYWFKSKLFGWGWTPARWQGWLVMAVFLVYVFWESSKLPANGENVPSDILLSFYIKLGISILILLLICFLKGEKPRWQWGFPKEN